MQVSFQRHGSRHSSSMLATSPPSDYSEFHLPQLNMCMTLQLWYTHCLYKNLFAALQLSVGSIPSIKSTDPTEKKLVGQWKIRGEHPSKKRSGGTPY